MRPPTVAFCVQSTTLLATQKMSAHSSGTPISARQTRTQGRRTNINGLGGAAQKSRLRGPLYTKEASVDDSLEQTLNMQYMIFSTKCSPYCAGSFV